MTNKANQWELDGRCDICRRQKYCSKKCRPRERLEMGFHQRLMNNGMLTALQKAMGSYNMPS